MTAIPPQAIPTQLSKASAAIEAATGGQRPKLLRTAGGLINDAVLAEAAKQGWPTSIGMSSRSTGSTTPTPRPPATC